MHESPIEINKIFKIKMTNSKTNKNSYNLYPIIASLYFKVIVEINK